MTENKRFTVPKGYRVIKDNVTNECATFYDNDDGETFLKWLNELHEENQSLKSKHMEMLDFIKEKGTVTVNDIKQWWNTTR